MARVVIPGGSGYLGQALSKQLAARGDDVVVLTRGRSQRNETSRSVSWDARSIGDWIEELDGADAIVHLNGRRVDTRATKGNVDELISSRVEPVRVVGEAIQRCSKPPPVWVQSSSLAIFGEGGDTIIDEATTPSGIGPREMVTVCLAWEGAFRQASLAIDRTVLLRSGSDWAEMATQRRPSSRCSCALGSAARSAQGVSGCPGSTSMTRSA